MMHYSSLPVLLSSVALVAVACPLRAQSLGENSTYGEVRLRGGFVPDPQEIQLVASGKVKVKKEPCAFGYVAEAPDLDFYYEGDGTRTLYFYVASEKDAILLVNDPYGTWSCDDDSYGDDNPLVVIPNAEPGLYNLWVGTYGGGEGPATLWISELDPR
jgi:hypothetical protein